MVFKNYNKREIVLRCINQLKEYFDIDKWQANQPIYLANIQKELFSVEGVQSVANVEIKNKYSTAQGYSGYVYDITAATREGIIYPSRDCSIFECKYKDRDIIGRAR